MPKLAEVSAGISRAQMTASLGKPVQGSAMSRIRPQSNRSMPLWELATARCTEQPLVKQLDREQPQTCMAILGRTSNMAHDLIMLVKSIQSAPQ